MAVSARPLLAIGVATSGIGVNIALAAARQAAAAPTTSGTSSTTSTNHRSHSTGSQQLVRKSAKATPNGGLTARTASSRTSTQGPAPTSTAFVSSSDRATQAAVKHHWGTHHGRHGLL